MNTRITYEAVFRYYKTRLAQVGVNDEKTFHSVVHAESMRRNRALEANRGKSAATDRGENGIMRSSREGRG